MPFDLNKIKNIAKDVSKEVVNVVGDKYLEIKANTNFDDGKYDEANRYGWNAYDERDFLLNDAQQANITYNYALIQEKLANRHGIIDLLPTSRKTKTIIPAL